MELGEDGRVSWNDGVWQGAWYEVNGNLVITWDCRAQEENSKTHFYRRIHDDVAGWELMERDGRPIPHKPQHSQRAVLLPKRVPPTSDEPPTSDGNESRGYVGYGRMAQGGNLGA